MLAEKVPILPANIQINAYVVFELPDGRPKVIARRDSHHLDDATTGSQQFAKCIGRGFARTFNLTQGLGQQFGTAPKASFIDNSSKSMLDSQLLLLPSLKDTALSHNTVVRSPRGISNTFASDQETAPRLEENIV